MDNQSNYKEATSEKADNREYIYVRYEDEDEMCIYDIINLLKKWILILKRYLVLLLIFAVLGGAFGWLKGKYDTTGTYSSSALLFVDLDWEQYSRTNDINVASTLSMLAKSFSQIVNSDSIMKPVSSKYAVRKVDIIVPDGTQTICVNVIADSAADAKAGCESLVDAGINAIMSATNYINITVVSPASEAAQNSFDSSAKKVLMTAAIFLLMALVIVFIRELTFAYKAHESNKAID